MSPILVPTLCAVIFPFPKLLKAHKVVLNSTRPLNENTHPLIFLRGSGRQKNESANRQWRGVIKMQSMLFCTFICNSLRVHMRKTLPKAQRTRGLSSSFQVQTQILIEFHLQNFDSASTRNPNQTSASPLNLKFKILTKPSFRILIRIQLHNIYKIV